MKKVLLQTYRAPNYTPYQGLYLNVALPVTGHDFVLVEIWGITNTKPLLTKRTWIIKGVKRH